MSYRVCSRCVLDTSVPEITFDSRGECQYCKAHDALEALYPPDKSEERLGALVAEIREAGRRGKYDVICGVSGGCDSSWTLAQAVKLGLRPLAVHLDNGWNTETARANMKVMTDKLGVELRTFTADPEEFSDLQISFLRASVSDAEVPTDVAIHSMLHFAAARENVRYVLNGHSFRSEGVAPIGWTYMDGRYIRSVQKKFGKKRLVDFKNFGLKEMFYYSLVKRIRVIPLLNYVSYDRKGAEEELARDYGWKNYGGHHHESSYTKMIQSYYLPKKFGIDKRRTEYSAMIRSGRMAREDALAELAAGPYPYEPELVEKTVAKLGLSPKQWEEIMAAPPKRFHDYETYYPLIRNTKPFVKLACELNLLPRLVYYKYLQ